MGHRDPRISDLVTLHNAKRMCRTHRQYRKVGLSASPMAARILTRVEVSVMRLTVCLPAASGKRGVPEAASLTYRGIISATTRSASEGRISRKQKKRIRAEAQEGLVVALDFLDAPD